MFFVFFFGSTSLLNEPDFVNRMRKEEDARSACKHSSYCIARMYSIDMACHQHLSEILPPCLQREIERIEARSEKNKSNNTRIKR